MEAKEGQARRPRIALTGASGYIGSHLLQELTAAADIIALSRQGSRRTNTAQVEWRSGDLFSMVDAEKALAGADYAVYLVHSMLPTAKLTQANFADMDVILADHFARAAHRNGVKQLVYLSGIMPPDTKEEALSAHLRSRLEVQRILESYGMPVTTIRAGLIVGPQGSSFPILAKLVRRLPVMILPKWTLTKTHPIALSDILHALQASIGNREVYGRTIDAGGPDVMSYKEMMKQTAAVMGKKIRMFSVPFFSVYLSRLWVSLITGTPKEMAYPLIESLVHPMVARPDHRLPGIGDGKITFQEAARTALQEEAQDKGRKRTDQEDPRQALRNSREKEAQEQEVGLPSAGGGYGSAQDQETKNGSDGRGEAEGRKKRISDVRSVQRVRLPEGKDAKWAGKTYLKWLSGAFKPFIRAELESQGKEKIFWAFSRKPLLELAFSTERSTPDRAIYWITGGAFANAKIPHRGRIEFLMIPDSSECIVAIHDYLPTLPWFFYKYTQAKVHLWVMGAFKRHLLKGNFNA